MSLPFWGLVVFLGAVFLLGGASRSDVPTLIIVRPLSAIMLAFGIWRVPADRIREFWPIVLLWVSCLLLALAHTIPLPPSVVDSLPGRDVAREVAAFVGNQRMGQPISFVPHATWNAVFALLAPGAALFLMLRCSEQQGWYAFFVVLACGIFSGILGLLQVVGDPYGKLYFYEITNFGSAVGIFANRNHQALFLACLLTMLGMLAAGGAEKWLGPDRYRPWLALGLGLLLLLLVLVTGSRAGLVLAFVGVLGACWIFFSERSKHGERRDKRRRAIFVSIFVFSVSLLATVSTVYLSRSHSIARLLATGSADELRFPSWKIIWEAIGDFFPFGSGIGSFPEVFQAYEHHELLQRSYLNHAHNDYLEFVMTAGLPGLLLLALGVIVWAWATYRLARAPYQRAVGFGRLGAVLILQIGLASIVDYPARTPAVSVLLVVSAMWLVGGARSAKGRSHRIR